MKTYICLRCEYKSANKTNLKKHFERKKKCCPLDSNHDINTNILIEKINNNEYIDYYNNFQKKCENTNNIEHKNNIINNENLIDIKDKENKIDKEFDEKNLLNMKNINDNENLINIKDIENKFNKELDEEIDDEEIDDEFNKIFDEKFNEEFGEEFDEEFDEDLINYLLNIDELYDKYLSLDLIINTINDVINKKFIKNTKYSIEEELMTKCHCLTDNMKKMDLKNIDFEKLIYFFDNLNKEEKHELMTDVFKMCDMTVILADKLNKEN